MMATQLLTLLLLSGQCLAFCGFYVAGAGAKIFNRTSQVILVRDGMRTVLTMQNDFQGSAASFAMVVPVPVVLTREQIAISENALFDYLDKFTGPRLSEYHDPDPCPRPRIDASVTRGMKLSGEDVRNLSPTSVEYRQVKVLAEYKVEEYDIKILGAKDSDGLEAWLVANGYTLPPNAREVLTPYIRNKLKFFVVKVDAERLRAKGLTSLRPLQITYQHERFMLPIRLGMANATTVQDLVIYAFTKRGRVECSNYRTLPMPTAQEVPVRVKDFFGAFYKALFDKTWAEAGQNTIHLEYAWDISGSNYVKCDPCATTPPSPEQLAKTGINWLEYDDWGSSYQGEVFVTRLHVRYSGQHFPEDLMFVNTVNQEPHQARYVIRHPYTGSVDCDAGRAYMIKLAERRDKEEQTLASLTGWQPNHTPENASPSRDDLPALGHLPNDDGPRWPLWPGAALLLVVVAWLPLLLQRLQNRLLHRRLS